MMRPCGPTNNAHRRTQSPPHPKFSCHRGLPPPKRFEYPLASAACQSLSRPVEGTPTKLKPLAAYCRILLSCTSLPRPPLLPPQILIDTRCRPSVTGGKQFPSASRHPTQKFVSPAPIFRAILNRNTEHVSIVGRNHKSAPGGLCEPGSTRRQH
jgi:hypothetical protein